jgi:hypothetical protein
VPNRNFTDLLGKFDAIRPGKREFEHGQHGAAFSAANIQNGVLIADVEIFQESNKDICSTMERTPLHIWSPTRLLPAPRPWRNRPLNYFLDERGLAQDVRDRQLTILMQARPAPSRVSQ